MSNQIVKADEATIKKMLYQPETLAQFESILGKSSARHYVGSVFLAVANSPELQDCHPESIIRSAMRCAAFELSCDPAAKQGQLVPFWNSKKGRKDAQLVIHYKGLSLLAQRSGMYRHCNVSEVYKGYEVEKDMLTGIHSIKFNREEFNASKVIGYLGYFETKSGFKKTVYWTIEEITAHAEKFAPKNPLYKSGNPHYKTMLEKTVWRDLLSWADLGGGNSAAQIEAALDDDGEYIDPQDLPAIEAEEVEEEPRSEEQNLAELGFDDDKPAEEVQAETAARFDAATLRKKIKTTMDAAALDGKAACTDAERKVLAAALGKIFKDSTMRYEFSEYMTGTASTKKMTPEAVNAMLKWLGDGKPQSVNFDYAPPAFITAEANAAHTAALVEKGQQPLI